MEIKRFQERTWWVGCGSNKRGAVILFTHSFTQHKYLLSACYVLDTVIATGDKGAIVQVPVLVM